MIMLRNQYVEKSAKKKMLAKDYPNPGPRVLLLGSHLGYNLEHYTFRALQRQGCEVAFLGYRPFLGRWTTVVRMLISRSSLAKRISFPFALRKYNETVK